MGDDSHSAFEVVVGIEFEMIKQLTFKGAVEGIAMRKVMSNSKFIHSQVESINVVGILSCAKLCRMLSCFGPCNVLLA